jgi:alpha-ketoglutarate-dependent taurine dioxygenase
MTAIGTKLEVRRLTARIGAEVTGLNLSTELDGDTVSQIRTALNEHKALVFRDVELDDAGQQRFAGYFGDLTKAHPTVASVEGQPNILQVDSEDGGRANSWHTDVTFVVNPPQASTLRSINLPPFGGETLIASTAGAYQDLPDVLRTFADSLWAVHTNDYDYAVPANLVQRGAEERRSEFTRTKFQTVHPVVRVHPLTGEKGLFIGGFAQRLVGLSNTESRDILRLLQVYVTRPENILRVKWQPNQLVLFDNRITQHYAIDNYDDQPRRLNRITVAGDIPVGVNGDKSFSIEGDASDYSTVAESPAAEAAAA